MKQVLLGLEQYVQDYDQRFPVYNVRNVPGPNNTNYWVAALQPYIKSERIFHCRSNTAPQIGATDYYYNRLVSGRTELNFKHSAHTVALCEGIEQTDASLATATAAVTLGTPPANARHDEGSFYAFVDGHVIWLQSSRTPSAGNVAATGSNFTFGS